MVARTSSSRGERHVGGHRRAPRARPDRRGGRSCRRGRRRRPAPGRPAADPAPARRTTTPGPGPRTGPRRTPAAPTATPRRPPASPGAPFRVRSRTPAAPSSRSSSSTVVRQVFARIVSGARSARAAAARSVSSSEATTRRSSRTAHSASPVRNETARSLAPSGSCGFERGEPAQDRVDEPPVPLVDEGDRLRDRGVGRDAEVAQLVRAQAQRRAAALGGRVDRAFEQRRERVVDRDQPAQRAVDELGRERRVPVGQAGPRERPREGEVRVRALVGDAPDHVERDRTRGRRRRPPSVRDLPRRPPSVRGLPRRPLPRPAHGTAHPSRSPTAGR